jgi:uncharacterized repeat protein (TIGR01451 family)
MKTRVSVQTILLAVFMVIAMLAPGAALAVGTVAGTVVSNTATVDYKVGGFSQATITSAATTFTVDAKVNFTVTANTGATNTVTSAGPSDTYYLTFDVLNTGNTALDFDLSFIQVVDDFDQTILLVAIDNAAGAVGTYDSANDIAGYINELTIGSTKKVFVVADSIVAGLTDGWLAGITLTATAWYGGDPAQKGLGGGNDAVIADADGDNLGLINGLDWELADTGNDGQEADSDNFLVASTSLSITKSSSLISDPINGTTNPIAIPGAQIQYTITVANAGGGLTATEITVTDAMPAEMTYSSDGIKVINTGAPGGTFGLTNAAGGCPEYGNACGWYDGTDTVIVNGITLGAGENTRVIFNATIK